MVNGWLTNGSSTIIIIDGMGFDDPRVQQQPAWFQDSLAVLLGPKVGAASPFVASPGGKNGNLKNGAGNEASVMINSQCLRVINSS